MKTAKTFAALSIALIFLGFAAFAGKPSANPDVQRGTIKYQVNIHLRVGMNIPDAQLLVMMTDEHNRLVALPQTFSFSKMTYVFGENGPVTGTRIAWIVQSKNDGNRIPIYGNTDSQKGTFLANHVYQFNIYPENGKPR